MNNGANVPTPLKPLVYMPAARMCGCGAQSENITIEGDALVRHECPSCKRKWVAINGEFKAAESEHAARGGH